MRFKLNRIQQMLISWEKALRIGRPLWFKGEYWLCLLWDPKAGWCTAEPHRRQMHGGPHGTVGTYCPLSHGTNNVLWWLIIDGNYMMAIIIYDQWLTAGYMISFSLRPAYPVCCVCYSCWLQWEQQVDVLSPLACPGCSPDASVSFETNLTMVKQFHFYPEPLLEAISWSWNLKYMRQ